MIKAQEWLEKNYPKEEICVVDDSRGWIDVPSNQGKKRNQITKLYVAARELEENLDLSDFINLKEFYCKDNQLTQLTLPSNQLGKIEVVNNHLTSFDYAKLNPQTLWDLNLSDNNLEETNILVFSPLTNLIVLQIGSTDNWVQTGQYNKFFGSLESLKNLTKLVRLTIPNTNINTGLEYLSENLKVFVCYSLPNSNFQVQELEKGMFWLGNSKEFIKSLSLSQDKELSKFIKSRFTPDSFQAELNQYKIPLTDNSYPNLYRRWKKDFLRKNPQVPQLISLKTELAEKDNQIKELEEQCQNHSLNQIELEKLRNELQQAKQEKKSLQKQLNEVLTKENTQLLAQKEQELNKLKTQFQKQKYITEDLLKAIDQLSYCDISSDRYRFQDIKTTNIGRLLGEGFKEKDINNLCNLQSEITHLKLQLENLKPKKQLLLTNNQKEQLLIEAAENPIFIQRLNKQVVNYFKAKQDFLNLRQETITLLQEVVDLLEKETILNKGKYVQREEGAKLLTATLKITPIAEGMLGTNELVGEAVSVTFNHFKRRFNEKNSQIFKQHLERSDNVTNITKQRNFLIEIINKNPHFNSSQTITELFNLADKDRIFNEEYLIFKVATNIWKHKCIITVDDMKGAIDKLVTNLHYLEREVDQERQEIKQLNREMSKLEQKLLTCSVEQK